MAISGDKLVELFKQSGLFSSEQLEEINALTVSKPDSLTVLRSLVKNSQLTKYQAAIFAAGRHGPFAYGDYVVHDRVESDRLRTLYDAVHRDSRHPVRLEFLRMDSNVTVPTLPQQVDAVRRHNELQHPQLTDCFELVAGAEHKFHVLEYLASPTLKEFVDANGPIAPERAARWLEQLANGLEALHSAGLTQGFLTPRDIVIAGGTARILRLPLRNTLPLPDVSEKPNSRSLLQFAHAAPERFQSNHAATSASDIYSLGNVINFMLLGRPFHNATAPEELRDRALRPRRGMLDALGKKHRPLAVLASKVLAKLPEKRPSAKSISRSLQPLLADAPSPIKTPNPATQAEYFDAIGRRPPASPQVTEAPKLRESPASVSAIPEIQTEPSVRKKTSHDRWILPAMGIATLVAAVWLGSGLLNPIETPTVVENPDSNTNVIEPKLVNEDPAVQPVGRFDVQPDDGRMLWAPTTNGSPVDLTYVPDSSQLILSFRPSELLANEQGQLVMQALGPAYERARTQWERQTSISLENVQRLLAAVALNTNGQADWVYDVEHNGTLPGKWQGSGTTANGGKTITSGELVAYLPSDRPNRIVIGSEIGIDALIGRSEPPILRRELYSLHTATDEDSQLAILFSPNFLLRDGRNLIAGDYAEFPPVVDSFFGDGVQAAALSFHVDSRQTFLELDIAATAETSRTLPAQLPGKLRALAEMIEAYIAGIDRLDPYWRSLALRYDNMVQLLSQQTRLGVEGDRVVINASLPPNAAHNLLLATELAIVSGKGQSSAASQSAGPKIRTMAELLTKPMSLKIPQQSLEFSVRDLMDEVNDSIKGLEFDFNVEIVGGDLEQEGITRNQQIRDFDVQNQPVSAVLTALMQQANPTRDAAVNSTQQKLVWVVGPPNEQNNPVVLVTTRKAAETKGYELPEVFQP